MTSQRLLSVPFLSLCGIAFLAICNVATFYNFHMYLQEIGIRQRDAGLLIGLYPLTAMLLYGFASQWVRTDTAIRLMLAGIIIIAGCGSAYLFVDTFPALVAVRIINGTGSFLLTAASMASMVDIIPPNKSGQAFSLYSVALLAPYSIMPAVAELLKPVINWPPAFYAITAATLLPAAFLLLFIRFDGHTHTQHPLPAAGEARRNLLRKPVLAILLVNGVYFTLFSSLFFLFKGLAVQRGIENPGFFFTIQMGVMVAIRLVGGHIFDAVSKVKLVAVALLATGTGFLLLYLVSSPNWIFPTALVFGLGMGLSAPPLNSLMYLVSEEKFRAYNANMMMLTIHFGAFVGPYVGSWVIELGGYPLFLRAAALLTLVGVAFFLIANPEKHIRH